MNSIVIKIFLPIFVLILTIFSCSNENTVSIIIEEGQIYSFSKFIGGISEFPYEAPIYKREKVISGFQNLKVGINKKKTVELLGEPDAESFSYDVTKGRIFKGSSYAYYLSRYEANLANNSYDEGVFIHFDINGKLYWAFSNNIEVLKEIGTPFP